MNSCYQAYNNICDFIENPLRARLPEIPKHSIKLILPSFICSFTVSAVLSGGLVGLAAGTLAVVAHLIHSLITVGIEKLNAWTKARYETPTKSPKTQSHHYTYLLALGTTVCIGRGLGMAVNLKATFFLTVAFLVWELAAPPFLKTKTPLMGIVVA